MYSIHLEKYEDSSWFSKEDSLYAHKHIYTHIFYCFHIILGVNNFIFLMEVSGLYSWYNLMFGKRWYQFDYAYKTHRKINYLKSSSKNFFFLFFSYFFIFSELNSWAPLILKMTEKVHHKYMHIITSNIIFWWLPVFEIDTPYVLDTKLSSYGIWRKIWLRKCAYLKGKGSFSVAEWSKAHQFKW